MIIVVCTLYMARKPLIILTIQEVILTDYTKSDTYRFQYSTHEPTRPAPVTHGNINGYEWVDLTLAISDYA